MLNDLNFALFIRLKVPIRQMLDRNEDMRTTGTRHPYLGRYKVHRQVL